MSYQLSKADKKVARACIDKGIDAEFRDGLEKFEAIIQEWRAGKLSDNREAYHKLYQAVREKDKAIGQRYDGLTGSRWLETVTVLLYDGYITEEDTSGFSEQTKVTIERWKKSLGKV